MEVKTENLIIDYCIVIENMSAYKIASRTTENLSKYEFQNYIKLFKAS